MKRCLTMLFLVAALGCRAFPLDLFDPWPVISTQGTTTIPSRLCDYVTDAATGNGAFVFQNPDDCEVFPANVLGYEALSKVSAWGNFEYSGFVLYWIAQDPGTPNYYVTKAPYRFNSTNKVERSLEPSLETLVAVDSLFGYVNPCGNYYCVGGGFFNTNAPLGPGVYTNIPTDGGNTAYRRCTASVDGMVIYYCGNNDYATHIMVSTNGGTNWNVRGVADKYTEIKCSQLDGRICVAQGLTNYYKSDDFGVTWNVLGVEGSVAAANLQRTQIAMSDNGSTIYTLSWTNGYNYIAVNGSTATGEDSGLFGFNSSIVCTPDGSIAVVSYTGGGGSSRGILYKDGDTWVRQTMPSFNFVYFIAISPDGHRLVLADGDQRMFGATR